MMTTRVPAGLGAAAAAALAGRSGRPTRSRRRRRRGSGSCRRRSMCQAPQYVAEDLLRGEGFTDVQYITRGRPDRARSPAHSRPARRTSTCTSPGR